MKFSVIVGGMIGAMVGCVISNFLYQVLSDQDWSAALERSYFQVTALAIALGSLAVGRAAL